VTLARPELKKLCMLSKKLTKRMSNCKTTPIFCHISNEANFASSIEPIAQKSTLIILISGLTRSCQRESQFMMSILKMKPVMSLPKVLGAFVGEVFQLLCKDHFQTPRAQKN
jgi:hypothetical protein